LYFKEKILTCIRKYGFFHFLFFFQQFFKQITGLLAKNGGKSSIYITQKRLSYNIDEQIDGVEPYSDLSKDVTPALHENKSNNKSYPILIRITDGNKDKSLKVKLSTIVEPENLDSFWIEYIDILKNGFVGLKKKTKAKKKVKKSSKSANV
jgi:hypothetical protein